MYQVVYSENAVRQLIALASRERRGIVLDRIEQIASNPFERGTFEIKDETGRENQMVIDKGFVITFWSDHAVKEVRVVDIRHV